MRHSAKSANVAGFVEINFYLSFFQVHCRTNKLTDEGSKMRTRASNMSSDSPIASMSVYGDGNALPTLCGVCEIEI